MRIYLDLCAWKRPYDHAESERVRLEALAVAALLDAAGAGRVEIVSSAVLQVENDRNPDPERRAGVRLLLADLRLEVPLDDRVAARARELQPLGLRPLDALHAASAEAAGCAYLVTTDDRMAAALRRNAATLHVRLADPMLMVRVVEGVEP